jgi:hypothetical protein
MQVEIGAGPSGPATTTSISRRQLQSGQGYMPQFC